MITFTLCWGQHPWISLNVVGYLFFCYEDFEYIFYNRKYQHLLLNFSNVAGANICTIILYLNTHKTQNFARMQKHEMGNQSYELEKLNCISYFICDKISYLWHDIWIWIIYAFQSKIPGRLLVSVVLHLLFQE